MKIEYKTKKISTIKLKNNFYVDDDEYLEKHFIFNLINRRLSNINELEDLIEYFSRKNYVESQKSRITGNSQYYIKYYNISIFKYSDYRYHIYFTKYNEISYDICSYEPVLKYYRTISYEEFCFKNDMNNNLHMNNNIPYYSGSTYQNIVSPSGDTMLNNSIINPNNCLSTAIENNCLSTSMENTISTKNNKLKNIEVLRRDFLLTYSLYKYDNKTPIDSEEQLIFYLTDNFFSYVWNDKCFKEWVFYPSLKDTKVFLVARYEKDYKNCEEVILTIDSINKKGKTHLIKYLDIEYENLENSILFNSKDNILEYFYRKSPYFTGAFNKLDKSLKNNMVNDPSYKEKISSVKMILSRKEEDKKRLAERKEKEEIEKKERKKLFFNKIIFYIDNIFIFLHIKQNKKEIHSVDIGKMYDNLLEYKNYLNDDIDIKEIEEEIEEEIENKEIENKNIKYF